MNYSEMSDFEINKKVADIAMNGTWHVSPSHPDNKTGGWLCGSNGIKTQKLPDYCNSWADAGPIIQEYGIELSYDGISWSAGNNLHDIGWYNDWKNHPESPCRLAMIVFLMMKESDNG